MSQGLVTVQELQDAIEYFFHKGFVHPEASISMAAVVADGSELSRQEGFPPGTVIFTVEWTENGRFVTQYLRVQPQRVSKFLS